MAESVHCQAVCDLLLRATNCSVFDKARADALDAEAMDLMAQLVDDDRGLVGRALTALALGGGLAEGQRHHETAGVLDALAGKGFSSEVLATSHAAWRISRNPMALLLPLVWQRWATTDKHDVRDDEIAPAVMLGCVPDYAIDQFTRVGGQVARGYLKICAEMDNLLEAAGIAQAQRPRALGDLIFLAEGGCITRRAIWDIGERLRRPNRALPYAVRLADLIQPSLDLLDATRPVIENLRQHHFHTQIIG
jgi:hypothetical protein